MSSSTLVRGTFILTLGTFISKFLGLFYVIPFYALLGNGEGPVALYSYGYVPYTIFLSVATAGVPLAVSKFIAKYNALEEYEIGRRLFRSGLWLMTLTGFIAFLIMYVFAPFFAQMTIEADEQLISVDQVTTVIRAVSFALIIIPFMSLIRGFFQGHQSMGPTAVSNVVEQIVRIVFLLIGVYVVLYVMDGSMTTAIAVATFGAFVGGAASLGLLIWYYIKRKHHLDKLLERNRGEVDISLREMYKEIVLYSIPFVLVGVANPLFQLIDIVTFNRAMSSIGLAAVSDFQFGILTFTTHKLVIIPVSLATAFAMTLIPVITSTFSKGNWKSLNHQLDQTFQILLFLTMPAAIGLALLAEPAYTVFYGYSELGTEVLRTYSPVAILFALYTVTAAMMQGINEQRWSVLSLLAGLLVKLAIAIPLVKLFEVQGAVLSTAIGYLAAIVINLLVIRHFAAYKYRIVVKRTVLMIVFNIIMAVPVLLSYLGLTLFLDPAGRWQSIIILIISGGIGAFVYFVLSLKSRLADRLFGDRITRLRKRFTS
ncbi:polysaccharide biosynthesis protein [Jeotgalibacillus sp. S-D1]|uniref:putative polysaccharide biosynthesis protein n=1 Tax=Jeotgalibacillus sp. S-D1 TaxID=2552189 RepID=UPI0010594F8A|nr:polysaccharide biosynthesis protein [Jeotgalibacillus sp. S-D1]TDL34240.1 polysaccharide biosynthesis protein [Jeotgalibacillus sp. S-D1]